MDPALYIVVGLALIGILIIVMVSQSHATNTSNQSALQHMKVAPASNEICNDVIPRKIHQVWVGSKPVPKHTQDWINLCKKYGYEYKLWREGDLTELMNQKYFDDMMQRKSYQGCADIARYEIVYKHGGLYIDTDMAPVDLDIFEYLPRTGFAITLEHLHIDIDVPGLKNNRAMFASNQFILSCPNSPILKRVIDSLPLNFESLKSAGIVDAAKSTGPYLLTACLFGMFTIIDTNWILIDGSGHPDFHLIEFYYD